MKKFLILIDYSVQSPVITDIKIVIERIVKREKKKIFFYCIKQSSH